MLHRFDADLNAAKDESSTEVQAKEKLAREKEQLQSDVSEMKEKVKVRDGEKESKRVRRAWPLYFKVYQLTD